jgi:tripartite-type tricarboxylate transporter receptor subunit TctC
MGTMIKATLAFFILTGSTVIGAPATAQSYPAKPVRWIVPLPPGGSTDLISRLIAQKLTDAWRVQVVVDNRPGAAGTLGLAMAAKSPPDGYTIVLAQTGNVAIAPGLYSRLTYDPVKDLAPVTQVLSTPLILIAHPSLPVKGVRELVALARAKPDTITYASGGSGGQVHLAFALLSSMAGVRMVHVPYKGVGPALIELIGGQVAISLTSIPPAMPHIKAGKLKALGVSSARRFKSLPEVPTIFEDGVAGYEVSVWYGVMMPAGTPPDIIARVNTDIVRILGQPEVQERFSGEGGDMVASTPEAFGAYIRAEIARWTKVITETGVKVD